MEALPQDLADFLVTKNFDPEYFNKKGDPSEAGEATTIKFDYVADSGKNYGTAVCVISDSELSLFYGDNLGRGMEPEDKQEWFDFLEQLSNQATSHGATWSPTEINKLKHTLAGIAAIKEGLFEGYYGNRKVSYMGEQTQARLVIKHNRQLGENDKRYRYVESLFIETADQERFRLPFKSLAAGRAMLEHVRQGGRPYDIRGNHITEMVSEMAVLSRFNRAQHNRVFEGITQDLVESAKQYYQNLQETMKHLGNPRGYQAYFESWAPDQTGEAEALVENLRDLFVEQTLDARIEAALPTLAKIQQQGNNMKEAQIFENWIQNLSEGTWALPETPEQMEKLNQLMSGELIVGPDATNATELLYDIVGDDELFDILNDLADRSEGRANIWDDSDVQRRLAELGVQTPQSTEAEPADVPQDTAPAVKEGSQQHMDAKHFKNSRNFYKMITPEVEWMRKGLVNKGVMGGRQVAEFLYDMSDGESGWAWAEDVALKREQQGMAEGDNMATFVESNELSRMLKHAGVPVNEGVLTDSTGSTLEHIKDTYKRDVKDFMQTGEMSRHLEQVLYDYYYDDMPYGAKTGEDIDTSEWISDRFAEDLGMNENLITPMIMPVSEGSCNMTAEGSYCPEHGLAECGGMYEGVNDPDYRGGYNNEFDELEDLLSKSGMSQDDLMRQRFLASKHGLNTPADMAKLPALKKDAEAGYIARKAALDADLEKRNQQYMQDKLTDLEYQQDPVAFVKRRTQQLSPIPPTAPTAPPFSDIEDRQGDTERSQSASPGTDYSLPRAKLGSSPSMKLPNFRPEPAAEVPAPTDQLDTRNQKSSMFQQLAQLRNRTRGNMAESTDSDWDTYDSEVTGSRTVTNKDGKDSYTEKITSTDTNPSGKKRYTTTTNTDGEYTIDRQYADEGVNDPINYNAAMTGAYYEGKETPTQEGDALLARIKSLALLK
jgi:hypothetical protein